MTSIRFDIGRNYKNIDAIVERVSQHLRHAIVEAKSCHDGALTLQFTLEPHAVLVASQHNDMLGAKISSCNDAVYHEFPSLGQVDKNGGYGLALNGHDQTPKDWGLHTVLPNEVESTAPPNEAA